MTINFNKKSRKRIQSFSYQKRKQKYGWIRLGNKLMRDTWLMRWWKTWIRIFWSWKGSRSWGIRRIRGWRLFGSKMTRWKKVWLRRGMWRKGDNWGRRGNQRDIWSICSNRRGRRKGRRWKRWRIRKKNKVMTKTLQKKKKNNLKNQTKKISQKTNKNQNIYHLNKIIPIPFKMAHKNNNSFNLNLKKLMITKKTMCKK